LPLGLDRHRKIVFEKTEFEEMGFDLVFDPAYARLVGGQAENDKHQKAGQQGDKKHGKPGAEGPEGKEDKVENSADKRIKHPHPVFPPLVRGQEI
jgi:hypothetical protein